MTRVPPCPVCGCPSPAYRHLSRDFLARALDNFAETQASASVILHDYTMHQCPQCTLDFADPLVAADDAYYALLGRRGGYYLRNRWEWDRVADRVAEHSRRLGRPAVLDIGSGDATFLQRLQDLTGASVAAIERSPWAVAELRRKGIEAYTPEETALTLSGRQFDFVLAFHCLEHVSNPAAFVRDMCTWAAADGRVLLSVPYSPMYFETRWFDPLNHPPHHLTRWNRRSLDRLAASVGGKARLELPEALPLLRRARWSLAIQHLGPHWTKASNRARWLPLRYPVDFARELWRQARRERVDGLPAADVVLVEIGRQ